MNYQETTRKMQLVATLIMSTQDKNSMIDNNKSSHNNDMLTIFIVF